MELLAWLRKLSSVLMVVVVFLSPRILRPPAANRLFGVCSTVINHITSCTYTLSAKSHLSTGVSCGRPLAAVGCSSACQPRAVLAGLYEGGGAYSAHLAGSTSRCGRGTTPERRRIQSHKGNPITPGPTFAVIYKVAALQRSIIHVGWDT